MAALYGGGLEWTGRERFETEGTECTHMHTWISVFMMLTDTTCTFAKPLIIYWILFFLQNIHPLGIKFLNTRQNYANTWFFEIAFFIFSENDVYFRKWCCDLNIYFLIMKYLIHLYMVKKKKCSHGDGNWVSLPPKGTPFPRDCQWFLVFCTKSQPCN